MTWDQREELALLRAENERLWSHIGTNAETSTAELERLRAEIERVRAKDAARIKRLRAEIERLRAELERLRQPIRSGAVGLNWL